MEKRKPYSDEFKQEAMKLVTAQGMNRRQAARAVGLDSDTFCAVYAAYTVTFRSSTRSWSSRRLLRLQ